jgi:hypothetical protein
VCEWQAYTDLAEYTAIVGHGGVPNLEAGPGVTPPGRAVDPKFLKWQNSDFYKVAEDTWSYGGYAMIEIEGDAATVQFYTEVGKPRTDEHGVTVAPDELKRLS